MRSETVLIALSVLCFAGTAGANDRNADFGKREYMNSCGVCHGMDGKGQADIAEFLKTAPPDLTRLSRKNGGVFPMARVYETIDGRLTVRAHGTRNMPIWGQRFSIADAPRYDDYPYNAEALVRSRILGLIDYLYRIQDK